MRWDGNPICPHCKSEKPYITSRGYKCSNKECHKKFTVKVGTIFEGSKISFRLWFAAIYICTSHKKGISSLQLSRDLNITQKTAWFMLHRIREMLKTNSPDILGDENSTIEIDETHIGGTEKNRHNSKRRSDDDNTLRNDGKTYVKQAIVIGAIDRKTGNVVLEKVTDKKKKTLIPFIQKRIKKGANIMTDENPSYDTLRNDYNHNSVNHSRQIYVNGNIHTNTIECVWSNLKRGIYGCYHNISYKHLNKYLHEFSLRYNTRKLNSSERFIMCIKNAEGGLLYKNLIS
jgi:transposase-like protein